jgi:starvation-inducible DNA-binding protein
VKDEPTARVAPRRIALDQKICADSVRELTQILADTMTLRDLYKKHHWQASGSTFYELHLLYDKHYAEQVELMDHIAERIQMLGGDSVASPHDVAEVTHVPRPPRAAEEPRQQLRRLLDAHELILAEAREAARSADERNDDGTLDLLASEVIPMNEQESWFIGQQAEERPRAAAASERRAPEERAEAPRHH